MRGGKEDIHDPSLFNFGLDPISLCSGRARFGTVRSSRTAQSSLRLDGGV
jgi:hypothetical protein